MVERFHAVASCSLAHVCLAHGALLAVAGQPRCNTLRMKSVHAGQVQQLLPGCVLRLTDGTQVTAGNRQHAEGGKVPGGSKKH